MDSKESSWAFAPGDEAVPGAWAWALLGDGRRCETWLAWCRRRWAPVAVKLPRPDQVNPRSRAALAREAEVVLPLAHPAIQRLLDARVDHPVPHLVFEYVEGPTLASLLDERGALAPGDVIRLGLQVSAALHYLHGLGIAHLDVKPGNLALRNGRAVLLDFDLARRFGHREPGPHPRGTPPYMAPEQVRRAPASAAMDLFALGATLYEAATDEYAFDAGGDAPRAGYPQLAGPPLPMRSLDPLIPPLLECAIAAMLAPNPSARPGSALEAMRLLAAALPDGDPAVWPEWVGSAAALAS